MTNPSYSTETCAPDRLIAGDAHIVTRDVTLTGSAALTRGAVLGMIAASGLYVLSASGASDGSEVPRAILVADADATTGDVTASIYDAGEFNEDSLNFGTGHDADSVREDLRAVGIHLKTPVSA